MAINQPYSRLPFAENDKEAKERADFFRTVDPFPDIPPALLWEKHFIDYARVTAMLHPFFPKSEDGRVKSASYEAYAGSSFIRWTPDGRKIVEEIKPGQSSFILPKNSIGFIQIESTIRLPEYIALRFNLRITHVHRGLLLGTGPLVDPQFEGNLLIPLHNLTDQDYEIGKDEGLIWIEFTKTSRKMPCAPSPNQPANTNDKFVIESYKKNRPAEYYFEKANHNNPIRSSIGGVIADSQTTARNAERAARRAQRASSLFLTIGFLGVAALVASTAVALHQYFGQIGAMAQNVQDKASTAVGKADQALSGSEEARKTAEEARRDLITLRGQLNALQLQVLERLNQQSPNVPAPRAR